MAVLMPRDDVDVNGVSLASLEGLVV